MEIVPQDDVQEHLAGDECWCNPKVEHVEDGTPDTIIDHYASDGRE